jgi:nucleotide-binding universal stress UspA family protein
MLKNLLVPLDGSPLAECVLPHAVAMAKAFNAQITLLNVLEQSKESLGRPKADPLDWYLQKTEAETYLHGIETRLEKSQLSVKTVLLEGRAIDQIIALAHTSDVDLLVLSSHGQQDASGWSVSGIVQQVVQRTRISTLIIPAQLSNTAEIGQLNYRRLLIPLDGSQRAGAVLPFARLLAQSHNAELTLAHVIRKPEMARHMPLTQEDIDLINRVVERNREAGQKYLEDVQIHLPTNSQTHLFVSDNIAATLQCFSEQEQIDLLILSAHGYSGEAQWPYGSVTNRFITDGTKPLLIVQDLFYEPSEVVRDEVVVRQMARQ